MGTLNASREIQANVNEVFDAHSNPERLARWWGPDGFSNTFKTFEFIEGGRWSFTMHGPDGKSYSNESMFAKIESPFKIVIEHISNPKYKLSIELTAIDIGTRVSWSAKFEDEQFVNNAREFLTTANQQNLERLEKEVLEKNII